MTEKEWELLDKTAIAAFGELLTQYRGDRPPVAEIAKEAWEAAGIFVGRRNDWKASRYDAILREYEGLDALRRIFELSGNTGRCLDSLVERYKDKPDPLLAYTMENLDYRSEGRIAVRKFLEKRKQ
jgi:hypothetical protein